MFVKGYSLLFLIISTSILIGCGTSNEQQLVTFENFFMEIENDFRSVPSGLVENKQLLNKVITSFKKDSDYGFETNFIITKSSLPPHLDYEQFWTVNTNKLKEYVKGYQAHQKQLIRIDCHDEKIEGIYVSFTVQDSFMQRTDIYYMEQYQFVYKNTGYILSYATAHEKERGWLQKAIKSLSCDTPIS